MAKLKVSKILKDFKKVTIKHSPEILTGLGVAGMLTTTVLAVKATPKAIRLIDEAQKCSEEELTKVEKIKVAWKPYIPAAIMGVVSTTCLIGASSVSSRRNAALATAYKLSETALTEYKEKVIETIGERKEEVIKDKLAKDRIEENPPSNNQVLITDKGNTLCYDHLSSRYFNSDIDKIKKAVNELNRRMLTEMYISLNEFYDAIGLPQNALGSIVGWNIDDGLIDIYFSSQITEDDRPCAVIEYERAPKYDYSKLY